MTCCHLCGRATPQYSAEWFVFGPICGRADCWPVAEALADAYKPFFFAASIPAENGDPGRPSAWTLDGQRRPTKGASA